MTFGDWSAVVMFSVLAAAGATGVLFLVVPLELVAMLMPRSAEWSVRSNGRCYSWKVAVGGETRSESLSMGRSSAALGVLKAGWSLRMGSAREHQVTKPCIICGSLSTVGEPTCSVPRCRTILDRARREVSEITEPFGEASL